MGRTAESGPVHLPDQRQLKRGFMVAMWIERQRSTSNSVRQVTDFGRRGLIHLVDFACTLQIQILL